ncbi:serine hydrolase domain-containing protein [uncultured Croceitalea sp.]|uniref:serine hydrolase domain-containing protein n=1 Tax=uncultured Croceitalea sp. TaxID=1798908 RepID=UPI003305F65B
MKRLFLFILACTLLTSGCSSDSSDANINEVAQEENQDLYFPPIQSAEWETLKVSELGWNVDGEQQLRNFLAANKTKAFLILKDGKIVIEWYFDDHTKDTNWYWASTGKTLTAFAIGLAQEDGFLSVSDKTSQHLGQGWTSLTAEQEDLITVRHQLTMTTGMNDLQFDCISPDCLTYLADAGNRWSYHNGPYTLLQRVVANATKVTWTNYFNNELRDKIGMNGFWFSGNDLNNVYYSTARSMARFGLLNLNNGIWDGETILADMTYLDDMKNTSQSLNQAYGYLWWLNGKTSYRAPGSQLLFDGALIPNAPSDTYAGLGKNDQKLYVIPSQNLVVVRMGEDSGEELLGPSSFDNVLWEQINAYIN